MAKTSIIVGQSSSLSKEMLEKYSLTMIPFVVDWKLDKNNLEPKSIFQKMADAEESNAADLPKTSHPAPWLFKRFFEEKLRNADFVIFISLSSKLSATFGSALSGKEMLNPGDKEKVFIVDCQNISAGEGLVAIKAAELAREGKAAEEIANELKTFSQKVFSSASIKDLRWLERGGRVGHLTIAFLSNLKRLGIGIIFKIKNGRIQATGLGIRQKSQAREIFNSLKGSPENIRIAIAHAQNEQAAEELKKLIKEKRPASEIIFTGPIDNIIGIHTGPGTLFCAWHPLK